MTLSKALNRKERWIFLLTCLLFAAKEVTYITVLYRLGKIADFAVNGDSGGMLRYSVLTLAATLLMYFFDITSQKARAALLTNGMVNQEDRLMKNVLLRSLPSFRRKEDAYYLNLFATDLKMYGDDYLDTFAYVCGSAASLAVSVAILFSMNPWLVAAAAVMTGVSLASNQLFTAPVERRRKRFSEASEVFTGVLKETMEGYETIHTDRSSTEAALRRFHDAGVNKQQEYKQYRKTYIISAQNASSISSVMGVLGTVFCAWLVMKGNLTIGLLLVASNYFSEIAGKVGSCLQYLLSIRSTGKLREKLAAECETPCLEEAGQDGLPWSHVLQGGSPREFSSDESSLSESVPMVEYDQVSFSFGERELYHEISCRFRPGGCYAIVGESGSGKSTLTKLLLKYYEDYTGTIRLAGQDIRQLSELEIYGLVGVIGQSPYLFNASLYDNITMFGGGPGKDSEGYRQLLQDLNLTELAVRVGDQPLGDMGDKISGGERQRINIARSFRNHPAVMIFDEPTSGLDPENVRMINEFIFRHREMTRIVITHDWTEEYLNRFDGVIPVGETAMERRNPA